MRGVVVVVKLSIWPKIIRGGDGEARARNAEHDNHQYKCIVIVDSGELSRATFGSVLKTGQRDELEQCETTTRSQCSGTTLRQACRTARRSSARTSRTPACCTRLAGSSCGRSSGGT
eukprot:scaffold8506_cov56-Phaeocystis_antarctica.AAC.1